MVRTTLRTVRRFKENGRRHFWEKKTNTKINLENGLPVEWFRTKPYCGVACKHVREILHMKFVFSLFTFKDTYTQTQL